jgi:hypothetical protein
MSFFGLTPGRSSEAPEEPLKLDEADGVPYSKVLEMPWS